MPGQVHTSDSSSVAAATDRRLAAVRLLPADDGAADENMWRCFGSTPVCQLCWWFSAVLQPDENLVLKAPRRLWGIESLGSFAERLIEVLGRNSAPAHHARPQVVGGDSGALLRDLAAAVRV